jgi:chromosome segregation ATPase
MPSHHHHKFCKVAHSEISIVEDTAFATPFRATTVTMDEDNEIVESLRKEHEAAVSLYQGQLDENTKLRQQLVEFPMIAARLTEANSCIKELKKTVSAKEKDVKWYEDELEKVKAQVSGKEKEHVAAHQQLQQLQSQLQRVDEQLKKKLENLEAQRTNVLQSNEDLEHEKQKLQGQLEQATTKTAELESAVQTFQQELETAVAAKKAAEDNAEKAIRQKVAAEAQAQAAKRETQTPSKKVLCEAIMQIISGRKRVKRAQAIITIEAQEKEIKGLKGELKRTRADLQKTVVNLESSKAAAEKWMKEKTAVEEQLREFNRKYVTKSEYESVCQEYIRKNELLKEELRQLKLKRRCAES